MLRISRRRKTYMKDILLDVTDATIDDDRAEFFTKLSELVSDYGKPQVLEALQYMAQLDSEVENSCPACREDEAFLALELKQLLIKWQRRSQPRLPMVNSPGSGRLQ
jgi:hypothetical protein